MKKKNVFTDIAEHPNIYLFWMLILYVYKTPILFVNFDGDRIGNEKGFWLFQTLMLVYSVTFLLGSYTNWKYNSRHAGVMAFFAIAAALLEVLFMIETLFNI